MNPYYDPEKLELELLSFDEPNLRYEYNTLCFWATKDGQIYTASDSGCSCPTPFESFSGETQKDVLRQLERVGSLEQAENIFVSWNKDWNGKTFLSNSYLYELSDWVKEKLK